MTAYTKTTHRPFAANYIWWSLRLALFAGFALGAHVISVIGFGFPLGRGFNTYIQVHGHLQLVGWVGLFIMGVSLYFIPRLSGVPIESARRSHAILRLIYLGLALRFFAHSALPYLDGVWAFRPVSILVSLAATMVAAGCLLYVLTVVQTIFKIDNPGQRLPLQSIRPFFLLMLTGWVVYPILVLALTVAMTTSGGVLLAPNWNELAVQTFINLVLLPVAFAFSIRLFPLFLRLPAVDWAVPKIAWLYALAVLLQLLPRLPPTLRFDSDLPLQLSAAGSALKGLVIIWFIWRIDVLTRRRAPWTVNRVVQPGPERKATRPNLPDYGEFGRFERLVYSSYSWLALAASLELVTGALFLAGVSVPVSTDVVRHAYLLGFITQLIFGMAPRMLPGFFGKKAVASPKLVNTTFWLINIAAISRVGPLLLPPFLFTAFPGLSYVTQPVLGLSGMFGMAAVACLLINLRKTAGQDDKPLQMVAS